jgi:hypothetical protein
MRRSYSHRREVFFQGLALGGRQGAAAPSQEHSPAQGGLAGRRCAGHEAPATPAGPGSGAYGQVLSSVGPVGHAAPGRPPRYWSPACRNAGHRQRIREAKRSGRLIVLLISSQIGTTSYRAVSFVPFRSRIRSSPDASGADSTPAPGLTWLLPGVQCRLEYLFRPLPETDGVVFSGVRGVGDRSPYERIGAARLLHSLGGRAMRLMAPAARTERPGATWGFARSWTKITDVRQLQDARQQAWRRHRALRLPDGDATAPTSGHGSLP